MLILKSVKYYALVGLVILLLAQSASAEFRILFTEHADGSDSPVSVSFQCFDTQPSDCLFGTGSRRWIPITESEALVDGLGALIPTGSSITNQSAESITYHIFTPQLLDINVPRYEATYNFWDGSIGGILSDRLKIEQLPIGPQLYEIIIEFTSADDTLALSPYVGGLDIAEGDRSRFLAELVDDAEMVRIAQTRMFVAFRDIPEPDSLALLFLGLAGLGFSSRLRAHLRQH